ncbi:MAG: hypothetical protein R6V17_07980 [Halanaerobacter sp.]
MKTKKDDLDKVLVIFNNSDEKINLEFDLARIDLEKQQFNDLITNNSYGSLNNKLKIIIDNYSVMILK